jgi:hypothetical protein
MLILNNYYSNILNEDYLVKDNLYASVFIEKQRKLIQLGFLISETYK